MSDRRTEHVSPGEEDFRRPRRGGENEGDGKAPHGAPGDSSVKDSGSVLAENSRESIYCMCIIGQIEGHYLLGDNQKATKYEHIIPQLAAIEEDERTDGVLLILNTMGGDVEAGLAIAELVASMSKPTVSLVLGGGHSIGVPLAVSARRSFIVPSATMTLHPVRISGTVIGAPQTYNYFHDMQERIMDFICSHSKADRDDLYELMMRPDRMANDIGSVLDGEEAVSHGLIDEVGGLHDALRAMHEMIGSTAKNKEDTAP